MSSSSIGRCGRSCVSSSLWVGLGTWAVGGVLMYDLGVETILSKDTCTAVDEIYITHTRHHTQQQKRSRAARNVDGRRDDASGRDMFRRLNGFLLPTLAATHAGALLASRAGPTPQTQGGGQSWDKASPQRARRELHGWLVRMREWYFDVGEDYVRWLDRHGYGL